ncbi:hypothetical protein BKA93DRAFT_786821 [Sparassis latifolia]
MSHPVITFPPRPPTRNTLTSEQRTQLMRSSNKLEQVLGSTPHVLDFIYTHACTCSPENKPRRRFFHLRSKSLPKSAKDDDCTDGLRSIASAPSLSARCHADSVHSGQQSWRSPYHSQQPPLVLPCSISESMSRPTVMSPHREHNDAISDSSDSPLFTIVSEAAVRREKMRRLTRKLGEGVPSHLVFPPEDEMDSDEETVATSSPTSTLSGRTCTLPTILEVESVRLPMRHEAAEQPPRISRFANSATKELSHRDAIYVIESPDELSEEGLFKGVRLSARCYSSREQW